MQSLGHTYTKKFVVFFLWVVELTGVLDVMC